MPAVVLSPTVHWRTPLGAMLRQLGVATVETDDVFEAVAALRSVAHAVAVLHAELPADEIAVFLKAAARHRGAVVTAMAGPLHDLDPRWRDAIVRRFDNPYLFVDIANWVVEQDQTLAGDIGWEAGAQPDESTLEGGATAPRALPASLPHRPAIPRGPLEREDIVRLRRLARHADYYTLLGVPPTASEDDVVRWADAWLLLLDPAELATDVLESLHDAIREVRGAMRDARLVLSDPVSRARYVPAASQGGGSSEGGG
jgi:hypothetical protein